MASPSETGVTSTSTERVLVTGLTGFTGRYVAEALRRRGYDVVGLTRSDGGSVDLADGAAVEEAVGRLRPRHVIHLAAIAHVAHANVSAMYATNILGTRNLLAALAKLEVIPGSVVLASSANIYGNNSDVPLKESSLPAPANDYAVSKLAMEYMARTWFERLPITIVRPFNYTGVGQSDLFLVPKLVSHFVQRKSQISLGNLDVARDFSDVRVVADIYARLLSSEATGQVLNICSSVPVSLGSLIQSLQALTGHSIEIVVDPALVRGNEVLSLYGSADKLRTLFPDYSPIPIKETLRWMIESA